jgi:hypothetical protein
MFRGRQMIHAELLLALARIGHRQSGLTDLTLHLLRRIHMDSIC